MRRGRWKSRACLQQRSTGLSVRCDGSGDEEHGGLRVHASHGGQGEHGARIREALTCELRVNDLLSSRVVEF